MRITENYLGPVKTYDFTNDDPDETVFSDTVAKFNMMMLTREEIQNLEIDYEFSLSGAYGLYRTGNGIPDAVVCDYEHRKPVYRYEIKVYQTQDSENGIDAFEEISDYLGSLLETESLTEAAAKYDVNKEYERLCKIQDDNDSDELYIEKCNVAENLLSATIQKIAKLFGCNYVTQEKADDLAEQFLEAITDVEETEAVNASQGD